MNKNLLVAVFFRTDQNYPNVINVCLECFKFLNVFRLFPHFTYCFSSVFNRNMKKNCEQKTFKLYVF